MDYIDYPNFGNVIALLLSFILKFWHLYRVWLLAESQKQKGILFRVRTNYLKNLEKKHVFTKNWRNIIFVFFHGNFYSFSGIVFRFFFHVQQFEFHGHYFFIKFTGKFDFHVHFFRVFQVFSRALFFPRATFSVFFTGTILIFTGEKNTVLLCGSWKEYSKIF